MIITGENILLKICFKNYQQWHYFSKPVRLRTGRNWNGDRQVTFAFQFLFVHVGDFVCIVTVALNYLVHYGLVSHPNPIDFLPVIVLITHQNHLNDLFCVSGTKHVVLCLESMEKTKVVDVQIW